MTGPQQTSFEPGAQALVTWFAAHRSRLPRTAFLLWPWARVSNADLFFARLDLDAAAGPTGPRAKGSLQQDLRRLQALFESPSSPGWQLF